MPAELLDGRRLSKEIIQEIKNKVLERKKLGLSIPGLAVIQVGSDSASKIYVKNKRQACLEVGFESFNYDFERDLILEQDLLNLIFNLNNNKKIHGILIQLPLPSYINTSKIIDAIDVQKDVDGFHPYNLGLLAQRRPGLRPCTPKGVMKLLDSYLNKDLSGLHAVILGASNIVGRPMGLELLMRGLTVTTCHRLSQNLPEIVKTADVLISAMGQVEMVKADWIKPGAIVIDIGINRIVKNNQEKLVGDVDFQAVSEVASWISPVPGGVGPMTVAMLLENTLEALEHLEALEALERFKNSAN